MTDFHTIITDDDGDGFCDDIHVVSTVNDNSRYYQAPDDDWGRDPYQHPRKKTPSIIPWNKKIKWILIISGILAIGGILSKIAFAILFLILS